MAIQNSFPAFKPTLLLDFAKTKRLDPRITFTRTTTATYYDGDTVAKAEENLLLQSQDLTTTWSATNITVTANTTTAPDGTSTAETIDDGTATAAHNINQLINGIRGATTYVFSCFLKDVNRQFATLSVSDSPTTYAAAKFDLVAGTAGSTQAGGGSGWAVTSSSITAAGNGWYRCVLIFVPAVVVTSFTVRIGTATDSTTFTASERGLQSYTGSNKQIYVWGAQLEQRSSVTAYTATTTQPITNYIPVLLTAPAGTARFNHDPVTEESLGLLIEEQRTNLTTYSSDFSNAAWVKADSSITSNTIVAPDGTLTGDKLVENTANTNHSVRQPVTVTSGQTYTYSCYLKAAERTEASLEFYTGATVYKAVFNLTTGAFISSSGTGSYTVTSVGNGWLRIAVTGVTSSTTFNGFIYPANTGVTNYTGNGYSGIFIWGAQLEAGAFPTSYIPTVAATVTRNADAASMTGPNFTSWFNAAEGAIYCESQTAFLAQNQGLWAIGNSSLSFGSGNMMYALYDPSVSGRIVAVSFTNGSQQVSNLGVDVSQTANTFSKSVYGYKVNDFAQTTNAASVFTDTSGTVPIGPIGLSIGSLTSGWSGASQYLNGTIKKLTYYPLRVTNAQLQALTS